MVMKKILNGNKRVVEDTLAGFAQAHRDIVHLVPDTHMLERAVPKAAGKVRFMMANGAGHEPAAICWVGEGMFDMNVVGEIFTCASAEHIYQGIKRLSESGPVLMAVQNHAGDVLNAGIALERALDEGLDADSVLFYDDVASAPREENEERRGIGGMLFYTKIVGALAEEGADREALKRLFERVRDATRTYSVAVTNCTHPVTGMSMFDDLPGDMIEMGMGVHGEGGGGRIPLPTSRELAGKLCDILTEDGSYEKGARLLVFINGAGGMTEMELYTLYGEIEAHLTGQGFSVAGCKVGNYLTTQELSGVSVSLCAVDNEMLRLWYAPCNVGKF